MKLAVAVALLLAATATSQASATPTGPVLATIQLERHQVLTGVLVQDIDGDGEADLVLATYDQQQRRRELRIHLARQQGPRYAGEPSLPPYPLERDVVAFTFADCHEATGRELVLFTPERVVAVLLGASEPEYAPLTNLPLVWPAADDSAALPLPEACIDLDGDGKDDLLVPTTDGFAVLLRGSELVPGSPFVLPAWQNPLAADRKAGNLRLDGDQLRGQFDANLGGDGDDHGPLLSLRTRAPVGAAFSARENGRRDLFAVRNGSLWRWQQQEAGRFAAVSERRLPLPPDRLKLFDPAFDVQLLPQPDAEGWPQLLLTHSVQRGEDIEVRVDCYQATADGWGAQPASRLRVQALAQPPQVVDAFGDGKSDLVLLTLRTDLLRGLAGDAPKHIEAQLNIFRGLGNRFASPAAMTQSLQLPLRDRRDPMPFLQVLPGSNNATGGVVLAVDGELQHRPLSRNGDKLQLQAANLRLPLSSAARLRKSPNLPASDLLVLDRHELLYVRMR